MCTDDDNFSGAGGSFDDCLDIAQGQLREVERLTARRVAARGQLRGDVLRRAFQGSVVPQVPLADGSGEHLDVRA